MQIHTDFSFIKAYICLYCYTSTHLLCQASVPSSTFSRSNRCVQYVILRSQVSIYFAILRIFFLDCCPLVQAKLGESTLHEDLCRTVRNIVQWKACYVVNYCIKMFHIFQKKNAMNSWFFFFVTARHTDTCEGAEMSWLTDFDTVVYVHLKCLHRENKWIHE